MKESTPEEKEILRIYTRFYLALQLRDICNEMPIHGVARKYDVPRGSVQSLAQTCQGFAAGMIKFCEQMGWGYVHTDPSDHHGSHGSLEMNQLTSLKCNVSRTRSCC
jgi:hypothetical protein